jgi:hypothetical protein
MLGSSIMHGARGSTAHTCTHGHAVSCEGSSSLLSWCLLSIINSYRTTFAARRHCPAAAAAAVTDIFLLKSLATACLPEAKGACLGAVEPGSVEWQRIAGEAARTVPGRENGGNCDIKNLTRGCRCAAWHAVLLNEHTC